MDSLVLELQHDAISSDVPIGDLLRKALVVSRKLSIKEFQSWVDSELNGYRSKSDVPGYRMIFGSVYYNPSGGWEPFPLLNFDWTNIEKRIIKWPAIEIEKNMNIAHEEGAVYLPYPPKSERDLMKSIKSPSPPRIALAVREEQFLGIIEGVRNTILNWALKLEEDGIMGEGMTFSKEEKQVASTVNYQVNNFSGNSSGIQVQQGTDRSQQSMIQSIESIDIEGVKKFINLLTPQLSDLGLSSENLSKIEEDIEAINSQLSSPNIQKGVIQNSLQSIRNVLEGMTGSLIASGLLYHISNLF